MKYFKFRLICGLFVLCSVILISCGKKKKHRGFTVNKSENSYEISVWVKNKSLTGLKNVQKLLIQDADSIIATYKYGTMIYGLNPENQMKSWFYIDTSNPANYYGPYSDEKFRTEEIITIGRTYLDSVINFEEYLTSH